MRIAKGFSNLIFLGKYCVLFIIDSILVVAFLLQIYAISVLSSIWIFWLLFFYEKFQKVIILKPKLQSFKWNIFVVKFIINLHTKHKLFWNPYYSFVQNFHLFLRKNVFFLQIFFTNWSEIFKKLLWKILFFLFGKNFFCTKIAIIYFFLMEKFLQKFAHFK